MDGPPTADTAPLLEVPLRLLDERSRPGFRDLFGQLARRATALDVALTHLRLSTLDLSERELAQMGRIRLVLSEVSAASLDAEAHAVLHRGRMAANLRRLAVLLHLGRIEVRSAPLGGWAPDFSVFRRDDVPFAVLVGPHRFDRGMAQDGPILASLHGGGDALRAGIRFVEVWGRAHDIRPAIGRILTRAEQQVPSVIGATSSTINDDGDSVDTPRRVD
ncbi:MAG: hypothetical protein AB7I30_19260 [Isosphaeraceae bacterium]